MKLLTIFTTIFLICFSTSTPSANIYSWIDENGVTHFTNYSPPPEARIVVKDIEIPRNTDTEPETEQDLIEAKIESNSQLEEGLEKAKALVEGLEDRLIEANRRADEALKKAEAEARDLENRLMEANQRAEEALESAEALEEVAYSAGSDYSSLVYGYSYGYGFKSRYRPAFHHTDTTPTSTINIILPNYLSRSLIPASVISATLANHI
jgi:vacuolar-type H+-ATPase subunit I/STV1